MRMYNLTEHGDNYSKTPGSFVENYGDEPDAASNAKDVK